MRHAATSACSCVQTGRLRGFAMSLNTVGATISRSLRATSNRTAEVGRLSASRWASSDTSDGRAAKPGRQSQGKAGAPDGPGRATAAAAAAAASSEPQSPRRKKSKEHTGGPGVGRSRPFTSRALPSDHQSYLWARHNEMKRLVHGKRTSCPSTPNLLGSCCLCPVTCESYTAAFTRPNLQSTDSDCPVGKQTCE